MAEMASVPSSETEVRAQITTMEKQVGVLASYTKDLELALVSVLRPPTKEESMIERDLVPLASELYNLNISIERAADRLKDILGRLEL